MILLLDNYDSFVYNLARYLEELGEVVQVSRNDSISPAEVRALAPSHLVVSPGPCTPSEAGASNSIIREAAGHIPVLGVCLGHQCLGEVFGARVVRGEPVHGKTSLVRHDGTGLFAGLPSPLRATRYHSLVLDPDSIPTCIRTTACLAKADGGGSGDGAQVIMAIEHREHSMWGVQFHPEAVLTEHGHALLRNFLALGRNEDPPGLEGVLPAGDF
ncbi:MAG: aminodeoxychorismate/anthranilate synthase component II [Gemmatimonadota bacterium]